MPEFYMIFARRIFFPGTRVPPMLFHIRLSPTPVTGKLRDQLKVCSCSLSGYFLLCVIVCYCD